MNDKTDKLSSLMDGEVRDQDAWFERLTKNPEMLQTWKRYHIARDAMKGQLSDHPKLDISAAVSEALKDEPVIFMPVWKRLSPRYLMKQAGGLAVAAAVGTIAVLSLQQTQLVSPDSSVIAKVDNNAVTLQQDQIRQVSFTTREKLDAAVEAKLSGYLVNHNEFSKTTRVSGVMPYSRIVSFVSSTVKKPQNDK